MVLECLFILNSDWVWLGLFELDFEGTIQDKGGEKWRRGVGVGIDRSYCTRERGERRREKRGGGGANAVAGAREGERER